MLRTRLATTADAKRLLEIYAPYVTDTTVTFEYEVPTVSEFEQRISTTLKDYPYIVAETEEGTVVGYAYAHRMRERKAYDWTVEGSIYVDSKARGLGVGKKLYSTLEKELVKQNVVNIAACVTEENQNSINFHEHLGYKQTGRFIDFGYKFNDWYDVVWLQKRLGDPAHPAAFIPYGELLKTEIKKAM